MSDTKRTKEPSTREVELTIEGMSCQHCVGTVTKALEEVPGAEEVEVRLDPGAARVRYNPTETTVELLRNAVRSAGYKVVSDNHGKSLDHDAALDENFRVI